MTDLASVPRVFWSLIPPEGKVDEPSVVHDYLYAKGGDLRIGKFSRADADRVLLLGCLSCGMSDASAYTIYAGVRVGGFLHWGKQHEGS